MARPSKDTVEKKDKIISLELFQRGNPIYFELNEHRENQPIQYLYAMWCGARFNIKNHSSKYTIKEKKQKTIFKEYDLKLKKLQKIDNHLFDYYSSLIAISQVNINYFYSKNNKEYTVRTKVEAIFLKEALGEKRFSEIPFYGTLNEDIIKGFPNPIRDFKDAMERYLNNQDIQKIRTHLKNRPTAHETIISRNVYDGLFNAREPLNKNTFMIEVDLTKSKKEIWAYVENIIDDYEENQKNIPNIYHLLNLEYESFKCDFENCLVEENKNKRFVELLSDILFIYDCKIANFDNEEINQEFKAYYSHGIKPSTIKKYYDIAIDHIDNQKYKSFLTGYK